MEICSLVLACFIKDFEPVGLKLENIDKTLLEFDRNREIYQDIKDESFEFQYIEKEELKIVEKEEKEGFIFVESNQIK